MSAPAPEAERTAEKSKKNRESRGSTRARQAKKKAQSGAWFIALALVVLAGSAAFAFLR